MREIAPGVKSFNGRTGEVVPQKGDYTPDMVGVSVIDFGTQTAGQAFTITAEQMSALQADFPPVVSVTIGGSKITLNRFDNSGGVVYYSNSIVGEKYVRKITLKASGTSATITETESAIVPVPQGASDKGKTIIANDAGGYDLAQAGSTSEGLPVNDVRLLKVRAGGGVNPGDVVNVENGEVFVDATSQTNTEKTLDALQVTYTDCEVLSEKYSIAATAPSSAAKVYLFDNETKSQLSSQSVSPFEVDSISLSRLEPTRYVLQYRIGGQIRVRVGTLSGTSMTIGEVAAVIDNPVVTCEKILSLDSTTAISVYGKPTVSMKVMQISGNKVTVKSTEYTVNGRNTDNVSVSRLPNDGNGNKRVCICFTDTGDGNKGKAVIATINSRGAVTFGNVITFNAASTTNIHCAYSSDGWMYVLFIDNSTNVIAFNPESPNERTTKVQVGGATPNAVTICAVAGTVVCLYNGFAKSVSRAGNTLKIGTQYNWNSSKSAPYPSASTIKNNKFLVVYSDDGNSKYGTVTILEVLGDKIAGSFTNKSKDAIALKSGNGGDTVKVGFGGYCACEGVTEGQMITSDGIAAYSPIDGWLNIMPEQIRPVLDTRYTGTPVYYNGKAIACVDIKNNNGSYITIISATAIAEDTILVHGITTVDRSYGYDINLYTVHPGIKSASLSGYRVLADRTINITPKYSADTGIVTISRGTPGEMIMTYARITLKK